MKRTIDITFGNHGTFTIEINKHNLGHDTKIILNDTFWISYDDLSNFLKDFETLINKYYI